MKKNVIVIIILIVVICIFAGVKIANRENNVEKVEIAQTENKNETEVKDEEIAENQKDNTNKTQKKDDKNSDIVGVQKMDSDGTISNISEILRKPIHFEGIDITNIEISEKKPTSESTRASNQRIVMTVKNNNKVETEEMNYQISLVSTANLLLVQIDSTMPKLSPGEEIQLDITQEGMQIPYLEIGRIDISRHD